VLSFSIVVDFEVFKNGLASNVVIGEALVADKLLLEGGEEA
jgi:hypothetical protein